MQKTDQGRQGNLTKQKQYYDIAYQIIDRGIVADQKGDIQAAIKLYSEGKQVLKEALQLRFLAQDKEQASSLKLKMQQNLEVMEGRLKELSAQFAQEMESKAGNSQRRIVRQNSGQGSSSNVQSSINAQKAASLPQGVDKKLALMILDEVLSDKQDVRWEDVAGLNTAKQSLQELVVLPALRPDLYTGLRSPSRGLLLFGPPGTGKTLLAKALAHESKSKFFAISSSALTSKWLGESEILVKNLFLMARHLQPSIIFIDEVDSLLGARTSQSSGGNESEASRRLKTEFLVQFDGVASSSDDRIVVLAATNRPQDLDEAARRRFNKRIYVPLPDSVTRKALLRHLLDKHAKHSITAVQLNSLVKKTEGYSCSDITALAREAALYPLRSVNSKDFHTIQSEDIRGINIEDFNQALTTIRSSVSQSDVQEVENWAATFGSSGQ